jgi:hypothetical protein
VKSWLVRIGRKSTPEDLGEVVVEASTAEEAAKQLEGGPIRFFYKGEDHWEYVGNYFYEVIELGGK